MTVRAKICGLSDPAAVTAALRGGAAAVGFVFYAPSPRAVTPDQAAALAEPCDRVLKTGLFVDPGDHEIDRVLAAVALDLIQLHGHEAPDRVAEIKHRFGRPVMKALKISGPEDIAQAARYPAADRLLFDAKPLAATALPGGNGVPFDWRLLAGRRWPRPWMLSGGLDAANVARAVALTGATWVDVSSGVEDAPGQKSPARIGAFLDAVRDLA